MTISFSIPDRRVPLAAVLADSLACALAFPIAAMLLEPARVAGENVLAVLPLLPLGLLLINAIVILLDPPEPPVWSLARAVVAGAWRASLLFIALLWTLILSGAAAAVPVALFIVAWGILMVAIAALRLARLLTCRRIPLEL